MATRQVSFVRCWPLVESVRSGRIVPILIPRQLLLLRSLRPRPSSGEVLLVLVLRGRGGRKPGRSKEWELQEATWGIEARSGWDDVGSFGGQVSPPVEAPPAIQPAQQNDIYAAAQRIQQPSQPVQQPQRWSQPTQQQQPPQGGIDTSFLDDLL